MFTSLTHHAYVAVGTETKTVADILSTLEKSEGISAQGNPDVLLLRYEVMGIDEAYTLKESARHTAVGGGKKIYIVFARGITREAQNALLKLFEEPPEGTHFFLIVPSLSLLLPTVQSRTFLLSASEHIGVDSRAGEFLSGSAPARLALVQEMLKSLQGEKKEKDDSSELLLEKGKILEFLDELERLIAKKGVPAYVSALEELLEAKKYSHDRAPSLKLLLEHLALTLPRVV